MEALCQLSYSPEEPTIYQRPRLGLDPAIGFPGTGLQRPPVGEPHSAK